MKNRKKNIHLVCDQVNNWSNKVMNKLNDQVPNKDIIPGKKTMSEVFASISISVTGELEAIIAENDAKRRENQLAGIDEEENYAEEIN